MNKIVRKKEQKSIYLIKKHRLAEENNKINLNWNGSISINNK